MNIHHRINYIEFEASDLVAIKKFYAGAFGWKFTDYGPEYAAFTDGTLEGGFTKGKKKASDPLIILFSVNLEKTEKEVRAHGGKIVKPAYGFPGGRRFHFADPHGNELAVWSEK